ncbi:MAG: methyl-coenzyme M reductase I operon protein C [Canidatus Methanoxibalbensis ujae]|nr:methyl-coenzyme M reductase I operon protein C [Candidatus Methanoxibalbensis ujae]
MPVGRETQLVICRKGVGLGLGGGLAQRGTFAKALKTDVVAVAMSPGSRHVPKPVCEITTELRDRGINVSELVLNAGDGMPADAPLISGGHGVVFGMEPREIEFMSRHKLALLHHGNVKMHFIYKVRFVLKRVKIYAIVLCQCPVSFSDFEDIGVSTIRKDGETTGKLVDIVSGIVRHESCPQEKLNEIVAKVRKWLNIIQKEEAEEKKRKQRRERVNSSGNVTS